MVVFQEEHQLLTRHLLSDFCLVKMNSMKKYTLIGVVLFLVLAGFVFLSSDKGVLAKAKKKMKVIAVTKSQKIITKITPYTVPKGRVYPVHRNITTTYFYVGEGESHSNDYISNVASAWDSLWQKHFGGVDDPNNRFGYSPAAFQPKENPFYFALPYNDFNENGQRKADASSIVYWGKSQTWAQNESMCKNRWIKITRNGKVVYAQWEDSGPGYYDDSGYVFGLNQPQNDRSGLDVSPAVRDYLNLGGRGYTDWQFVDASSVPNGPWKEIVTSSKISW